MLPTHNPQTDRYLFIFYNSGDVQYTIEQVGIIMSLNSQHNS